MADTKISALSALTALAINDLSPLVDVSDTTMGASGTDKTATMQVLANFLASIAAPQGHILGLEVDCGSNTQATMAPGVCRDSTNVYTMTRTTAAGALTVDITVSGAGGLDTGSEANSTWYNVWFIQKSSDGTQSLILSVSATAPTMPAGYDIKRRVGELYNNASGNLMWIRTPKGMGCRRRILYRADQQTAPLRIVSAGNPTATTWTDANCAAAAPPTCREVVLQINLVAPSAIDVIYWREKGETAMNYGIANAAASGQMSNTADSMPVDSSQVGQYYANAVATDNIYIDVIGYYSNLLPAFV